MSSLFHGKIFTPRFLKMNRLKREETHISILPEDYIRSLQQEKQTAQKLNTTQRITIPHFLNTHQVLNFVLSGFCLSLFVQNSQILTKTTFLIQKLS
jgi:hypothetical protein